MKKFAIKAIRFYQRKISPLFPPMCRYYPTCSNYMIQAIERFGFWKGVWLGTKRLMRCNIFFPGGVDPVPDLKEKEKSKKTKSNENK
ncbi:MAG: membrane protein insertion efficiency factor YidD [Clostridiales bacterium]|nr:membrane protein insertion efficiency factor YidD [Clostridiales bacterium]